MAVYTAERPMRLVEYVSAGAIRGACTCPQCIDALVDPESRQPNGHTVDLTFFKVAAGEGTDCNTLRALVEAEVPHYLDGKEHNYLEVGADLGDQGLGLMLIGLGHVLGLWKAVSPDTLIASDARGPQDADGGCRHGRLTSRCAVMSVWSDEPESEIERLRRLAGVRPLSVAELAIDDVLRTARCTGVLLDMVTDDYIIWLDGRILGWAPTAYEAVHRLATCREAQAEHEQERSR